GHQQPALVEGVDDDHEDRQEQEREDQGAPRIQQVVGDRSTLPHQRTFSGRPSRSASRSRRARLSGQVTTYAMAAPTRTVTAMTMMRSTAIAEPSAQF